ncbi:hypothetical protein [Micavibrio aeruginosavorus]|uniref:Uncharacterized protein n=1 Tax=Micavibrio aeruginosavorus (strain ARL-13) TaxID=856793 RepID=G2KNJ5_MICAA|nr:hypothetical protein [Micavibrio aeruginosavorus]AEP10240.1 hypothetical protein MICA_1931 [Micavibrio aeruginosavorus ARL-13]
MTTTMIENKRSGERGNVLFLILIAVALFAALSYAVTQSTRSGSGDASGETNLISSAQLTQYPAGIRTSIVRMIIAGAQVEDLLFNPPSDFASIAGEENYGVFHPQGGGSVFTNASADMLEAGADGRWYFNMQAEITNVGINGAGGNDLIAFLPGMSRNVCRKINDELGIVATGGNDANGDAIPTGPNYIPTGAQEGGNTNYMNEGYTAPGSAAVTIGLDFTGQPFGCYDANNSGDYVYYHVLVER